MAVAQDKGAVRPPPKDEEELELEKLVFGDAEGFLSNLKKIDNLYDFSDEDDEPASGSPSSDEDSDLDGVQDDDLFVIDDGSATVGAPDEDSMDVDQVSDDGSEDDESEDDQLSDAWNDSDDERFVVLLLASDRTKKLRRSENDTTVSGLSYAKRLRSQFEKIYPRPEWVDTEMNNINNEDNSDGDDNFDEDSVTSPIDSTGKAIVALLESSEPLVVTKQLKLIAANKISISRLKNANHSAPSKGSIQSIAFHSTHPLLLTGGFDRTLRVYHIDGKSNGVVSSLHLRNVPVMTCAFLPNSNSETSIENHIFAAGRRRYMSKWNLASGEIEKISRMFGHEQFQKSFEYFKVSPRGNYIALLGSSGWCNMIDSKTGQWVQGFKVEGTIADFDFTFDESHIIIANTSGDIWEFLVSTKSKTNQLVRRWLDESGVGITRVKLGGPKSRWLAVGSNSGIVNIYDRNRSEKEYSRPIKAVENLVTLILTLLFSPDGQILVIASRAKKDALRLVHLPSCLVYLNWPTSGTPLGRVTSVSFSPTNQMLAVANDGGKVTLWRLNHY